MAAPYRACPGLEMLSSCQCRESYSARAEDGKEEGRGGRRYQEVGCLGALPQHTSARSEKGRQNQPQQALCAPLIGACLLSPPAACGPQSSCSTSQPCPVSLGCTEPVLALGSTERGCNSFPGRMLPPSFQSGCSNLARGLPPATIPIFPAHFPPAPAAPPCTGPGCFAL
eukprot:2890965-Rhodomonas_salina.1